MSKIFATLAAMIVATSCSTTSSKFVEPERTGYYIQCINGGLTVTVCECAESKTVAETSVSEPAKLDEAAFERLRDALMKHVATCQAEALK